MPVVLYETTTEAGSGGGSEVVTTTANYLYGLGSTMPLYQSRYQKVGAGSVNPVGQVWYHSDGLGSVRALSEGTSGTVLSTFSFTAFGLNAGESSGASGGSGKGIEATHQFAGEQLDPTGLYFNRARYYQAELGRFISLDPLVGNPLDPMSFNRYSYVNNNPANLVDPSGLLGTNYEFEDDTGEGSGVATAPRPSSSASGGAAGGDGAQASSASFNQISQGAGKAAANGWDLTLGIVFVGGTILKGLSNLATSDGKAGAAFATAAVALGSNVQQQVTNPQDPNDRKTLEENALNPASETQHVDGNLVVSNGDSTQVIGPGGAVETQSNTSGSTGVTKERYTQLRASPNDTAKAWARENAEYVNPFEKENPEYHVDHIVALKRMTEFEGFAELTYEQQWALANHQDNLMNLEESANTSKQQKTWAQWERHKKLGPVPQEIRDRWIQKEQEAERILKQQIRVYQQKNAEGRS